VKYGDVVKGLPIATDSCEAIYCSHVLEHLALEDCRTALKNTYSYLKHGGIFRLVVPDLETIARDYVNSGGTYKFMEIVQLGRVSRPKSLGAIMRSWLGSSHHLWMWDFKSLRRELETVGFQKIRRAQYGDSSDAKFREVELEDRWQFCLGMECLKQRI
jgi:ubiquinone/menaquinone biosynthesis C-methylase UbiE